MLFHDRGYIKSLRGRATSSTEGAARRGGVAAGVEPLTPLAVRPLMPNEELHRQVLARVRPDEELDQRIDAAVEGLRQAVAAAAVEMGLQPPVETLLVGSVAKRTHLRNPDLDVFVLFDPSVPSGTLESAGLAIGRKVLPDARTMYAQHPYTRGTFQGLAAEIVPCYRVKEAHAKMSAVDRTPFHTRHVIEQLRPGQADEVRLLKQFLKGIGAYGAESTVQGFSGYLVELLILHAGTFEGLMEQAAGWRRTIRIPDDAGARRFATPLVVIDPVDRDRNVAAALSPQSFALFVAAARAYRRHPTPEFFHPRPPEPWGADRLASTVARHGRILGLVAPAATAVEEIYYPQVVKALRNILAYFERAGFPVLHAAAPFTGTGADVVILFELEIPHLAPVRRHEGPPVGMGNEEDFLAKWRDHPQRRRGPTIVDGKWVVDVARERTDAMETLRAAVAELDLGPDMTPLFRQRGEILEGPALVARAAGALTTFLDPRLPWER